VEVKRLNEQVRRNRERFPPDFAFQLAPQEVANLKSQFATASSKRNVRFLPLAFTEHGAVMAATVLNSPKAVEMSVFVVRAFVKMREQLMTTAVLAKRLAEVEKLLLTHDSARQDLYRKIRSLLLPPTDPTRRRIGFGVQESRAHYHTHHQ
jgi:hypothetical protein